MSEAVQTLTVVITLSVKPRGGRKAIVTPAIMEVEAKQDITLIKAVARAFRWRRMLESGRFGTLAELAAAEKINASYVSRVLRLTLLAPVIVEAIVEGTAAGRDDVAGVVGGGGGGVGRRNSHFIAARYNAEWLGSGPITG